MTRLIYRKQKIVHDSLALALYLIYNDLQVDYRTDVQKCLFSLEFQSNNEKKNKLWENK